MQQCFWSKAMTALVVGSLFTTMAQAQLAEFNSISAAVRAARESGDHPALLANISKLAALTPGHPGIQLGLARALALNGDAAGAVAQLNRLADLGFSFGPSNDTEFEDLKGNPAYVAAAQRLMDIRKGLGRQKAIIKLGFAGGSEGVAWSESSKSLLMGSNGLIYAFNPNGDAPARPVAKAVAPHILGIRPDAASRSYLACENERDGSNSAVVRHREADGAVMAVYKLPTKNALCNDIALLNNGSFAVTDSNNGAVFNLRGDKLEPLTLTTHTYLPNGIASDLSNNRLYVAHANGVVVHNLDTGTSWELEVDEALIGALDGMALHNGSLIAVQGLAFARMDSRLLRIAPDADARTAKVEVLLTGEDFPGTSVSTVAVVGDDAFVIARTTIPEVNGERVEPFLIRVPL